MAGKPGSRWANAAEDAELDAKLKREKEEKRRRKQEKIAAAEAAKAEAERQAADNDRPSKRRKLTPDPTTTNGQSTGTSDGKELPPAKLLRFERGGWGMAKSVEEYDKLNDIEEGTYGWVSRATSKRTGEVVALKRLKLDPVDRGGLPVTGLREIQILKDCRHRNIVELKEVVIGDNHSKLDNSIFLVLEFMEHDLKSILDDMPSPFLASEIKLLLLQLTTGLSHLHAHHILHRDLKTSNLLLNNRGVLKIADFGMARYYSPPPAAGNNDIPASQQQKLTQLVVTLWYRSPELLLGTKTYGAEVDMWSVGCIFGELITREPLLQGKNEADQITQIFDLCGFPTDASWPSFRRLPNARSLRLPRTSNPSSTSQLIRAKFPSQTSATTSLLSSLLALDPTQRPTADEVLRHDYLVKDAPKPKPESMFPTFPSKAGQERTRRKAEPHAPGRGDEAVDLGEVDFSGIFGGRDKEERGAGFTLRMV